MYTYGRTGTRVSCDTSHSQIVGIADTGVDYSNCLLSESPKKDPPLETVDTSRRKIIGYHKNVSCELVSPRRCLPLCVCVCA